MYAELQMELMPKQYIENKNIYCYMCKERVSKLMQSTTNSKEQNPCWESNCRLARNSHPFMEFGDLLPYLKELSIKTYPGRTAG
jgi:hypothetical protein